MLLWCSCAFGQLKMTKDTFPGCAGVRVLLTNETNDTMYFLEPMAFYNNGGCYYNWVSSKENDSGICQVVLSPKEQPKTEGSTFVPVGTKNYTAIVIERRMLCEGRSKLYVKARALPLRKYPRTITIKQIEDIRVQLLVLSL